MDKVSVFESSDFGELRIIVDPKGDVWFVASDVAKSLGYINAKDAVKRHVDDDDSMLLQVSDNQWGVKRSILKTRYIDSIRIINESGLYSLITNILIMFSDLKKGFQVHTLDTNTVPKYELGKE